MKKDFDRVAARWDQDPERAKAAGDIAAAIRNAVRLSPEMDVLDYGCGTGLLTLELQPYVRTITGMDSSPGMLGMLKEKIRERGLTNVRTLLLDMGGGETIPHRFHLVASSMTLHHVKEISALFRQFYRCLHPGGHLCIADLDPEEGRFHGDNEGVFHFGFDRSVLRGIFLEAGFVRITDGAAATMMKKVAGEGLHEFSVFLMTGQR